MVTLGNIYITSVLRHFADVYGAGTYNSNTYSASGLVNTGIAVGLFVGISAFIVLVAVLIRVWRRPSKKSDESSTKK